MKKNYKFLLITPSFKRPYMLRNCVMNSVNQTYTNFCHSIVINQEEDQEYNYEFLLDDVIKKTENVYNYEDPFMIPEYVVNYKINEDQHLNYISTITYIIKQRPEIYNTVDYILKWDDDEIHKADFLKSINDFINNNPGYHIYSSKLSTQLNNYHFTAEGSFGNLGGVPEGIDIGHPATMAFDKIAAEMILLTPNDKNYWELRGGGTWEDTAWLNYWNKNNLKFKCNHTPNPNYVWHIHGGRGPGAGNVSISNWVRD